MPACRFPLCFHRKSRRVNPTIPAAAFSMQIKYKRLSPHVPHTSPFFSSVFHTASALSAPTGHLPLEGKAIKLSGRTFLAPHRGSSPMGLCKRTGFLGVKRRENPVRLHILPSALPPKGEARRYVANDFLNLIALPARGRTIRGKPAVKRPSGIAHLYSAALRSFDSVLPFQISHFFSAQDDEMRRTTTLNPEP